MVVFIGVDGVSTRFFQLVDWLGERIGADDVLRSAGYAFFKFWTKNPF